MFVHRRHQHLVHAAALAPLAAGGAHRRECERERRRPLPRCAALLGATAERDCHQLAAPAGRAQPRPLRSGQQLQRADRAAHVQRAERAPAAHAP